MPAGSLAQRGLAEDVERLELARQELVTQLETLREDFGLAALLVDETLDLVAQEHAEALAQEPDSSLESPPVRVEERLGNHGYSFVRIGAKLARTNLPLETLVQQWRQNAQESRRSLFDPEMRSLGVGVAAAGRDRLYVVVVALSAADKRRQLEEALLDLEAIRAEALVGLNEVRQSRGLPSLSASQILHQVATDHAERLAKGEVLMTDNSISSLQQEARRQGYKKGRLALSVLSGPYDARSFLESVRGNPSHSLLERDRAELGFGVAVGESPEGPEVFWVTLLGGR